MTVFKPAIFAALLVLAGCTGEGNLPVNGPSSDGTDSGRPAKPDVEGMLDMGRAPDAATSAEMGSGPDMAPPEPPRAFNPNTLDQDRLFTCEGDEPQSSLSRIRRLRPDEFRIRFVPRYGSVPYAPDARYRYSTLTEDARIDDASADQMLTYAVELGGIAAGRRIGWGYCMRQSTLDAQGLDRPTPECLTDWAATYLLRAWQRPPSEEEVARLVTYANESIDEFGIEQGLTLTAARPFLAPEFLFKEETAAGESDRVRLDSWAVANGIAALVTDMAVVQFYYTGEVDEQLFERLDALRIAAVEDQLGTAEQVEAHVRGLLDVPLPTEGDPPHAVLPSNIARFFQEYFGHPSATEVFKNGGVLPREANYIYYGPGLLVSSMDHTIAAIYQQDRQVLQELLTTRDFFVRAGGNEKCWPYNLCDGDRATPEPVDDGMTTFPAEERAGMLTHPAWLVAHSRNQDDEPHPVHRGKWIFENLLCNAMPDLPITVDAKLPDLPSKGVRERLELATGPDAEDGYCWGCHRLTDPLGIPFEQFTHYGRFRTEERTPDGTIVPVDPSTTLVVTGDPALDGKTVANATELAELLANSERVEGCFVRNAFRYFAGRNETYEDSCTLASMRDAYRDNDGSFREMLVALATSDAFLYRHPHDDTEESP